MALLRILVAGDPASIHANRFVNLLQEIGYDVRMFQSEHYYSQEEHLHDTVVYVSNFDLTGVWGAPERGNTLSACSPFEASYDAMPLRRRAYRLAKRGLRFGARLLGIGVRERTLPDRALHLRRVIEQWRPDAVISLKMQNDGYTVAEALAAPAEVRRPPWVHFTWGTDIEFFGKHPDYASAHLPRIRAVLAGCDFLIADCRRDVRQARELGFAGLSLGQCVAPGGFDMALLGELRSQASGARDVILVKGREGDLVGRALNVIEALARVAPLLRNYRIRVMMATDPVRAAVRDLAAKHALDCEVLPKLPYRELLLIYGRSRLAISASDVDGTPSFLIEAMAMGALPVHSDMESVREWIEHGVNGLLFPVNDVDALAGCIERGLSDDALCFAAAEYNWNLTRERMDRDRIRAAMKELIETRVLPSRASATAAA